MLDIDSKYLIIDSMTINSALKKKNLLAKAISEKQPLLVQHNSFKVQNKATLPYNTKDILDQYVATIDELVKVKTAIARANNDIYDKIFRIAELKGLVTTLKSIPVKQGVENEPLGFRGDYKEVEYDSTLTHADIDQAVKKYEDEIQSLQDELDKFNFTHDVE